MIAAVTPTRAAAGVRASAGSEAAAFDGFFGPPRPQPAVADRVARVLAQITPGQDPIVLWVPGTNELAVPVGFEAAVRARTGHSPVLVPYEASWRLMGSLPDGEAVLRGVLDALAARPGRPRVLLAGQSQGAWAIANVMGEPGRRQQVDRVAVFGVPGLAYFRPGTHDPAWLSINHDGDPVTYPLRRDQLVLRQAVDLLASGHLLRAVPGFLQTAFHHPGMLASFVWSKLKPLFGQPDPHGYNRDMAFGADFLLRGSPA